MFNAWTIWWNAESFQRTGTDYMQAPIFFPERNAFAFSEPQPATLLVAPLLWWGKSPAYAYQVYLISSLFLNAFLTLCLVRYFRQTRLLSFVSGCLILTLPLVHGVIHVLQLVPIWSIIGTWFAMRWFRTQPSYRRGLLAGLCLGYCGWVCLHQALLLTILLSLTAWPLLRGIKFSQVIGPLLLAAFGAICLIRPFAVVMKETLEAHQFARADELIQKLSAQPQHYLHLPDHPLLTFNSVDALPRHQLCPGWLKIGLAGFAIGFTFWRRKCRPWIIFLTLTGVVAFLFSLGLHLQVGNWKPWNSLGHWIPGIAQVRSVYRFAFFVQLAVVFLAVEGLSLIGTLVRLSTRTKFTRRLALFGFYLLCGLAIFETWPVAPTQAGVPVWNKSRPWIEYLQSHTPPGKSIACLPFADGNQLSQYDLTARWMYYGTMHGRPLVNGYSGFFPESYYDLRRLVNEEFPSQKTFQEFRARQVEFLVVLRSVYARKEMSAAVEAKEVEHVLADSSGIDIYRLMPATERRP